VPAFSVSPAAPPAHVGQPMSLLDRLETHVVRRCPSLTAGHSQLFSSKFVLTARFARGLDLMADELIGKWRIGEELGTGHFAKVKLGTHIETGKACAIKIVKKPQGALLRG